MSRYDLGEFLRARRDLVSPDVAGLVSHTVRRVKGLVDAAGVVARRPSRPCSSRM
ncbi:hypothetical protein [Streptomyces sp. NRRL S-1813]|uniref:hypothetical protein n=1 Tax=Streptomyces sp. NRRL S-1813 TaxID=1463888 RepID=UPI00131E6199|nr:hypothetical protein [Streptomyces sp. NRRL S-1813]